MNSRCGTLAFLFGLAFCALGAAFAGATSVDPFAPILLRDIQVGTGSSDPASFIRSGEYIYFDARSTNDAEFGNVGRELWRTDGTPEGTTLVMDINPGSADGTMLGSISGPVDLSGTLYFPATSPAGFQQLWKTTGSPAAHAFAGGGPTNLAFLTLREGRIFFSGGTVAAGNELYSTDGTESDLVTFDLIPGSGHSGANVLGILADGRLALSATQAGLGRELWISDGTPLGTSFLKDIAPNAASSSPFNFISAYGVNYFSADGPDGFEPWTTDGTEQGTVQLMDFRTGPEDSFPFFMGAHNGWTLMAVRDFTNRIRIYRTDGTAPNTTLLKDINPTFSLAPSRLTVWNGVGYFDANDGVNDQELWTTDGTEPGTEQFVDLRSTPPGARVAFSFGMVEFEGLLYFAAADETSYELWRTDGTPEGTTKVTNLDPGGFPRPNGGGPVGANPQPGGVVNGRLIFGARTSATGQEIWALPSQTNGSDDWQGYP